MADRLGRDRGSVLAFATLFEREFGWTVPISAASSASIVAQLAVVLGAAGYSRHQMRSLSAVSGTCVALLRRATMRLPAVEATSRHGRRTR
jgi:hypothetical protein